MSGIAKFNCDTARTVADSICASLMPFCERIEIAGSLRRKKQEVGDIEILFIPKLGQRQRDLFETETFSFADRAIESMVVAGLLTKRLNKNGITVWGKENKLAIHAPSGIPVDLFSTDSDRWWNALVCRTGGKENNLMITTTALRQGWSFEAYGKGFHKCDNSEHYQTRSERDVFEFIGLQYVEPCKRL